MIGGVHVGNGFWVVPQEGGGTRLYKQAGRRAVDVTALRHRFFPVPEVPKAEIARRVAAMLHPR